MNDNIVLITSVINTPELPLSYSRVRSVFSREDRFIQTKKTITSIKNKLPNVKIMIVECSDLNEEERDYLNKNCDYILNLWENKETHKNIFGISKALGEGTMTISALRYIKQLNIEYKYLYKISGRYWLNDNFKLDSIESNVFKKIDGNPNNIFTALYKLDKETAEKLTIHLISNIQNMRNCIGYEVLMASFVKNINTSFTDIIGLSGFVTVTGEEYNG